MHARRAYAQRGHVLKRRARANIREACTCKAFACKLSIPAHRRRSRPCCRRSRRFCRWRLWR
eukprot:6119681-Pleurochrysis_carterae.AAC.2